VDGIQTPPSPVEPIAATFPTQDPDVVREVVTVAHFNIKRLRELVDRRPTLARAAWDWGFGDWETALGAASHMGKRLEHPRIIGGMENVLRRAYGPHASPDPSASGAGKYEGPSLSPWQVKGRPQTGPFSTLIIA